LKEMLEDQVQETGERLSKFDNVFCDSREALKWAYQQGLDGNARIRTSAPAMLWEKNDNIEHVEACWTSQKKEKFQNSIQKHTEDVFDVAMTVLGIERERALCISQATLMFQRVLYKAACLDEADFLSRRLFVKVEGNGGPSGNNMNSPWDQLLSINPSFLTVSYRLQGDDWGGGTVKNIPIWKRIKLGGLETVVYRLMVKLMPYISSTLFRREVLIPSENELVIETAASLVLRGAKITTLELGDVKKTNNYSLVGTDYLGLIKRVLPVVRARVGKWVVPQAVDVLMSCYEKYLRQQLVLFDEQATQWAGRLEKVRAAKKIVLMNSPGNLKGQSLALACRKKGIPLVGVQHGVMVEISKLHGEVSCGFDNSVSDVVLVYNNKVVEEGGRSHFDKAKHFVVGASARHIRMKSLVCSNPLLPPMVYISTNLYKGNIGLFVSTRTDYDSARAEQGLINNVLRKLPHKVRYKTYPDENRRYADDDPVLIDVKSAENIELFSEKVDMRYLLSGHRVLITSCATSTLSWAVMTGKPVVFINTKQMSPLTDAAYVSLSHGLFLFDGDEPDFFCLLRDFLSQSVEDIEKIWEEKKEARERMIREFFTAYPSAAGRRAARKLLDERFESVIL